jgi:formylglycine-generating enzyme required for sulfatase activity
MPEPSFVQLSGGTFQMGSQDAWAYPGDGEGPVRDVTVAPFAMDAYAVSNDRFAGFVAATGYLTTAERLGTAFVFAGLLPDDHEPTRGVVSAPWWREVEGADWAHPQGPRSGIDDRGDHPVVQVSWDDASAYASWAGARLPTEAEWEYAARGGLEQQPFPWGSELTPGGEHRMNVWQGTFPSHNTGDDGYVSTAPVHAYPPNGFGLHNVTGNVWEWTADRWGDSGSRVMRGGSYLCHASYCRRYRTSARTSSTPDSASGNVGFRLARSLESPTAG